jgi:hypothetical protein
MLALLKLCQPLMSLPSNRSFQPAAFSRLLSVLGATLCETLLQETRVRDAQIAASEDKNFIKRFSLGKGRKARKFEAREPRHPLLLYRGLFREQQPIKIKRVHHVDKAVEFDWFDKISVRPGVVSAIDIGIFARRREHDDRQAFQRWLGTNPIDDFKTIFARHFQVEQKQIRQRKHFPVPIAAVAAKIFYCIFTILHTVKRVGYLRLLEGALEEEDVILIVFRQQNTLNLY